MFNVTTRSSIYYLAKDVKVIEFKFHFYSMLNTDKLRTVCYVFYENRIVITEFSFIDSSILQSLKSLWNVAKVNSLVCNFLYLRNPSFIK